MEKLQDKQGITGNQISESSNNNYHKQHRIEQRANYQDYAYKIKHYDPDNLKTSYQNEYTKKSLPTPLTFSPNFSAKKPPQLPFQDETQYKKVFQPLENAEQNRFQSIAKNMILPQKFQPQPYKQNPIDSPKLTHKHDNLKRPTIKFEGVSQYKSTFVEPPKILHPPVKMEYQLNTLPFRGQTTYKNTFVKYELQHPDKRQFAEFNVPKQIKFEGKSAYQEYFDNQNMRLNQIK